MHMQLLLVFSMPTIRKKSFIILRFVTLFRRLSAVIPGQAGHGEKKAGHEGCHCHECGCHSAHHTSTAERLRNALVKGATSTLETEIKDALEEYGTALAVIEGPLMAGMETVGKLFGEGKMFLPQVVKSAKIMRDAVDILEP